ncbi:MAG: DUF3592 domain-containing protein [Terriglobia bacterium]
MGGLLVDVIIAYIFKTISRGVEIRRAGSWPNVKGTVLTAGVQTPGYGCPTCEVVYTFVLDGRKYSGMHEKPFMAGDSAKDYASRFQPGQEILVGYDPASPSSSFVR